MGFLEMIKLLLDCVVIGLLISTLMWFISNKYLVKRQSRDYDVEWGYAFKVHFNAFQPLLVILHFIQLFFISHVILTDTFIGYLVGNTPADCSWLLYLCNLPRIQCIALFEKYSDSSLPLCTADSVLWAVTGTRMELYPCAVFFLQV